MEETITAVKIIGLVIGILVLGAGVYYLIKEKQDPESQKIYTIVSVIGAAVAAVSAVLLFAGEGKRSEPVFVPVRSFQDPYGNGCPVRDYPPACGSQRRVH